MAVPHGPESAGALLALVLAAGLLVACDAEEGESGGAPAAGGSPSTTGPERPPGDPSPRPTLLAPRGTALEGLPAVPRMRSAAVLATHLGAVQAVLGDVDAHDRDVRRAAEFEQLAARALALAPRRFQQSVLVRLDPPARVAVRADLEAAALLHAMTPAQRSLPEWRIVQAPPPRVLLGHYRLAARRIGVPWTYLAAIHLVETRMGRIRGVSSAGAQGPMQFLPTTWDLYGEGGDINDPRDSILAAARLLRANGAPEDMADAVWHYNPSDGYVGAVTRYAEQLQRSPLAYRGYWHWRVLYRHTRGTYVLEPGYPDVPARLVP